MVLARKVFLGLSPWRGWCLLKEGGVRLSVWVLRACSYKAKPEGWHQGLCPPYSSRGFLCFCFLPQQRQAWQHTVFQSLIRWMIILLFFYLQSQSGQTCKFSLLPEYFRRMLSCRWDNKWFFLWFVHYLLFIHRKKIPTNYIFPR